MHRRLALLVLIAALTLAAQDRFGEGDRRFKAGSALPGAIIEIRTENPDGKVRGVTAGEEGRFRMRGVVQGGYIFKITKDGFQSVFGHISVSRTAKAQTEMRIAFKQGV